MSATTQTATRGKAEARAVSLRWIISAREDLVWFIGSVASSYALFALYVGGLVPLVPMVVAWAILIDAPHVFAHLLAHLLRPRGATRASAPALVVACSSSRSAS